MAGIRSRIHVVVKCDKHGAENKKLWTGKMVKTSMPKHKRDKMRGCPICRAESKT